MNNKKYIITLDLGGTTFSVALFDLKLDQLFISKTSFIQDYQNIKQLIDGIADKIKYIYFKFDISSNDILGLGISTPGPLDSDNGMILDTPNLLILQNINLVELIESKLKINVTIENDANLFAIGEWNRLYIKESIIVCLTLGTGLGIGIIINGKLFKGAHGMASEYGVSPFGEGVWEDMVSIRAIEDLSMKFYGSVNSPEKLYEIAMKGDGNAKQIWSHFGSKLGLVVTHLINLIDPSIITFAEEFPMHFHYFLYLWRRF